MTRRIAAISWIGSVQFFVAQAIVQSAWTVPFGLTTHYISDLGNTSCAFYPPGSINFVCSPWHAWMNASFLLVGLTTTLGAVLAGRALPGLRGQRWGLALIAIAGVGFALVGLFPEDVNFPPHKLGAGLQFVCGNLGQVVLGIAMLRHAQGRWLPAYSIASGVIGLSATGLFVSGHYLGTGIGGMERLAAYPLPVWCVVMGLWFARQGRKGADLSRLTIP